MTLKITSARRVSAPPPPTPLPFEITPEFTAKVVEMASEMLKPLVASVKELSNEVAATRSEQDKRFRDLEQSAFGHRALRTQAPAPVLSAQEQRRRKDPARIFDGTDIGGTYRPPAGGASFLDVTGITPSGPTKAEIAAKKFDALPAVLQAHAHHRGIVRSEDNLAMMGAAAMLHRASRLAGGSALVVHSSDVGRALGVTSQKAEILISQAVRQGFVRAVPTSQGPGFAAVL